MSQHFDIAVLGTGPGGYVAALKAAQLGASVAVVEQHPFFGGTCLNWGCIPSKALLASAGLLNHIRHASSLGIEVAGQVTYNWDKIQQRKDQVIKGLRGGIKGLFAARKITSFTGKAVLEGPGRIAVLQNGAAVDSFTASKVILATGSVPFRVPGWPDDPAYVCTSDEALHWKTLPSKLLIVGGGVIGCEFACMMYPLGVEVTIVEMMPQLLPGLDGQLAEGMKRALEAAGVKILVGTKVEGMELGGAGVKTTLGGGTVIEHDRVLVSIGRRPATAGLGLEDAGIKVERGFVQVNDKMETSLGDHYCIGDANGKCLLAHAASAHGVVAAENALGHETVFSAPIPSCVYTFPEIAAVGMTHEQARAQNIPVAIGTFPIGHLGKAMAVGETDGFVKIIRHRESGLLLGVHMMGHNVTEIIASATALLHQKATVQDVAETVFAHPTISEAVKEAAEDALGAALHLPPRKVIRVAVGAQ